MSEKTEDQIREGLKLLAEDVQPPEGDAGRRILSRRLPRISPRLGAAFAGAAICAALAAVAATGAFDGSRSTASKDRGRTNGGSVVVGAVGGRVTVDRGSDGMLNSVHVGLRTGAADTNLQLEVVHSTPAGGHDVVYTTQISTNPVTWLCATDSTGAIGPTGENGPIGWSGPHGPIHECHAGSKWSGTLVPSDWRGGCQSSGEYDVLAGGVPIYKGFTCGQEGPTP